MDFINVLKDQYDIDEKNQERGLYQLDKWVSRKLIRPYSYGFKAITVEQKGVSREFLIKNIVSSCFHTIEHKYKEHIEFAFRSILK